MKNSSKEKFGIIPRFFVGAVANIIFLELLKDLDIEIGFGVFPMSLRYIVAGLLAGIVMGLISTRIMRRDVVGNLASMSVFLGTVIYLILMSIFYADIQTFFTLLVFNGVASILSGWVGGLIIAELSSSKSLASHFGR